MKLRLRDALRDLFRDIDDEDSVVERVSVLLPHDILLASGVALESHWKESFRKGWVYRVDPPDPRIPLQRHVHIAKEKHRGSKAMQVSWNADGTRHDKHSFNDKLGQNEFVQKLARDALKIPDNVCLESHGLEEVSIASDDAKFSEDFKEAFIKFMVVSSRGN